MVYTSIPKSKKRKFAKKWLLQISAQIIREHIKLSKKTQIKISEETGITTRGIRKMLESSNLKLETLFEISRALDINASDLVKDIENHPDFERYRKLKF